MPIELTDVSGGYNISTINENFSIIQDAWDEKLDRLVSTQGNEMNQDLDMNGYSLLNAMINGVDTDDLVEALQSLQTSLESTIEDAEEATSDANSAASSASQAASDAEDVVQEAEAQLASQEAQFNSQMSYQESEFNSQIDTYQEEASSQLSSFSSQMESALSTAGYTVVGNFEDGVVVTSRSDAVYLSGDYEGFYIWTGSFPKTVSAGTDPITESGWMLAATGYVKQSSAIQLFGQTIDADLSIPVGQNALSINPTVSDGVTVTVPEDSQYVILGSTS